MSAPSARHSGRDDARPGAASTALLLIDVLSTFQFDGGTALARRYEATLPALEALLRRARKARAPIIYANDNFGDWRSDISVLRQRIGQSPGAAGAARLAPGANDYFILKPRHSAFYCTPLPVLLDELRVNRLVLCGLTTNSCVFFTACDAHVRKISLVIASDATTAPTAALHRAALDLMAATLGARVAAQRGIAFGR